MHWVDYIVNNIVYSVLRHCYEMMSPQKKCVERMTRQYRTRQSPRQRNRPRGKSLTLRADHARCKLSRWLVAVDGSVTLTLAERHLIASALDAAQHHLCHIAAIPVPGFLGEGVVWDRMRADGQLLRWAHASLHSVQTVKTNGKYYKTSSTSADK